MNLRNRLEKTAQRVRALKKKQTGALLVAINLPSNEANALQYLADMVGCPELPSGAEENALEYLEAFLTEAEAVPVVKTEPVPAVKKQAAKKTTAKK